jgi:hypothetical protein
LNGSDISVTKQRSRARGDRRRRKSGKVTLGKLAHFTVQSVRRAANKMVELQGVFTHLIGVRLSEDTDRTVGFLYLSRKKPIYLLKKKFDPDSRTATLIAWPSAKSLRPGKSLPYVDYYWGPKEVAFALESARAWKKVMFKAEDSVRYGDPQVPGWWKSHVATHPVSEGASGVQIIKKGWDHEHCYLCKSRIGRAGGRFGYYSKADNDWLCVSCYKKFIARHDLRFLQFKN